MTYTVHLSVPARILIKDPSRSPPGVAGRITRPRRLIAHAADPGAGPGGPSGGAPPPVADDQPLTSTPQPTTKEHRLPQQQPGTSTPSGSDGAQRDIFIPAMVAVALVGYALVAVLAFLDQ
ncbi:hypothetical protein Vretimale_2181 [Volvox reticuliferus]|uniref:Uncharacterized protein n=1 Tax=Volvox reticuliferus TaxID=1737510 RepID=A0A8J4G2P4_9CHLO|nr:hypothetical protein Vretifemale_4485 [Volvox reticuliferus]GIL96322.1 hypothetical protein Vretimale_2181 [Volvox reticuliferus]